MDMAMLVQQQVTAIMHSGYMLTDELITLFSISHQGEVINRIETHVQHTYDYVEKAREQTKQAMEYQKKSRKVITNPYCALPVLLPSRLSSFYAFPFLHLFFHMCPRPDFSLP